MAPGIVENEPAADFSDPSTKASDVATVELRPTLYANVDQGELQEKTSQFLFNYGTTFIPDIVCGAKGLYVYTANGHKVLDWTSGQMSCLLGHGHPEIVKTITDHAASLDHLFSGMISPPVISLGERLCSLLPDGLDKAFFLSTGVRKFFSAFVEYSYSISIDGYIRESLTKLRLNWRRCIPANLRS